MSRCTESCNTTSPRLTRGRLPQLHFMPSLLWSPLSFGYVGYNSVTRASRCCGRASSGLCPPPYPPQRPRSLTPNRQATVTNCYRMTALPRCSLRHHRTRYPALVAAGCTFGCLSNVGFRGASQYVFLMYDTGAGSGQDGDVALVSEYFGRLCRLWTAQIVLHALELAVMTQADLQVVCFARML